MSTSSFAVPLANYFTKHKALADNTKTTVYTCGDQSEIAFDVVSLSVSASTANADTVTLIHYSGVDNVEYTLVFLGAVGAAAPYDCGSLPIHMVPGDIIKATATAGATHTLHVHLTGIKTTRTTSGRS